MIYVRWIDSKGVGGSWTHLKDLDHQPSICESVGWVIHEDEQAISVAPHRADVESDGNMQVCGEMIIPKCTIIERKTLAPMGMGAHACVELEGASGAS